MFICVYKTDVAVGTVNEISKSGIVSLQKGFVRAPSARTSLAYEDEGQANVWPFVSP